MDVYMGPVSSQRGLAIGTMPGRVIVFSIDRAWGPRIFEEWEWRSETTEVLQDIVRDQKVNGVVANARGPENFLKVWAIGPGQQRSAPIWALVLLCGGLAIVIPIRWSRRFSLRTLLVAMTLVGVAGGFVVWSMG